MIEANQTIYDTVFIHPSDYQLVAYLELSYCGIEYIETNTFTASSNLLQLILAGNKIQFLEAYVFHGLHRLHYLDISDNPLTEVMPNAFAGLKSVSMLDIRETHLDTFDYNIFADTPKLDFLYSDKFLFCCLVGEISQCLPEPDQFSSCKDLMRNLTLRVLMWILGLSALVGNVFVIVWRLRMLYKRKKKMVVSLLVSNLAISDCLMGIYMISIASADLYYRDVYVYFAEQWQSGVWCKFAGVISVLSSEASLFFLTVISIDRYLCIVYPFSQVRLRTKSAIITVIIVWVVAFILSILPVIGVDQFGDAFYGRSSVCLALPLTTQRPKGWQYSIVLFLGLNLAAFLVMAFCYITIYLSVRSSAKGLHSSGSREHIKLATRMVFLVLTDMFCWMPIIVMGCMSQVGIFIPPDVYAWTAVLVLPLNSSLNPYLYTILTSETSRKKGNGKHSTVTKPTPVNSRSNSRDSLGLLKISGAQIVPNGSEFEGAGILLHMALTTQRNSRLLPFMTRVMCREFLLSTYQSRNDDQFTMKDIEGITADLNKALEYLHNSNVTHGCISEDLILIERISKSESRRAFLMMPGKDSSSEISHTNCVDETSGLVETELRTDADAIREDKKQMQSIITRLSTTSVVVHDS
ncbi:G-protein coupled receptor GRL101-like [Amphiura filiformis]|uniref:G-protein coupled receptor GRL101-like n=1 Tax=Amphiura filiformis TaxID=82378 RepID=UPI003B218669